MSGNAFKEEGPRMAEETTEKTVCSFLIKKNFVYSEFCVYIMDREKYKVSQAFTEDKLIFIYLGLILVTTLLCSMKHLFGYAA